MGSHAGLLLGMARAKPNNGTATPNNGPAWLAMVAVTVDLDESPLIDPVHGRLAE